MLTCCEKVKTAYYTVAKIKTIIILNRNGIGVRELKQNFYNHNGHFFTTETFHLEINCVHLNKLSIDVSNDRDIFDDSK